MRTISIHRCSLLPLAILYRLSKAVIRKLMSLRRFRMSKVDQAAIPRALFYVLERHFPDAAVSTRSVLTLARQSTVNRKTFGPPATTHTFILHGNLLCRVATRTYSASTSFIVTYPSYQVVTNLLPLNPSLSRALFIDKTNIFSSLATNAKGIGTRMGYGLVKGLFPVLDLFFFFSST